MVETLVSCRPKSAKPPRRGPKTIIINNIPAFNLDHTLSCGQVFRWRKIGDWWCGTINESAIKIRQVNNSLEFASNPALYKEDIYNYFALDLNLDEILACLDKDKYIHAAIEQFHGLRIIRQEPQECLISYILSSNNNIPRINTLIENLSSCFSAEVFSLNGFRAHKFPALSEFARAQICDLKNCKVGFRAPYIRETAQTVFRDKRYFENLRKLDYNRAKEKLISLKGVGDKIADCVLLFSLRKYEAFPVDVWIARAMNKFYFKNKKANLKEVAQFGRDYFGRYAGWAQEYLYCYIRTQEPGDTFQN